MNKWDYELIGIDLATCPDKTGYYKPKAIKENKEHERIKPIGRKSDSGYEIKIIDEYVEEYAKKEGKENE